MRVLVTGGAGYVGSHVVRALLRAGHETLTYDNLSRGHEAAVEGRFCKGDLLDRSRLAAAIEAFSPEVVVHLAGLAVVAESVKRPGLYFRNNVTGTLNLLEELVRAGVDDIVFSSSAAVYGSPGNGLIPEDAPPRPGSPYGDTKLAVERLLGWMSAAHGLRAVSFRYFNAGGADPEGRIGEAHDPETHLIPLLCRAALAASGEFTIHGDDYDTPDGTCVRDYVHVSDLAEAHVGAVEALARDAATGQAYHRVYNLGTSHGYSVRQVVDAVRKMSGARLRVRVGPRREGDTATLVAAPGKAVSDFGWQPVNSDLDTIVATAWSWQESRQQGRGY